MIYFDQGGLTVDDQGIRGPEHSFTWDKVFSYGSSDVEKGMVAILINHHTIFTAPDKITGPRIIEAISKATAAFRKKT